MFSKTLKTVKFILYILCFSTLFLPMNYRWHTNEVVLGINYFTDLAKMSESKEELYWFFYYFILFILPSVTQIVFWCFSKKQIWSDIWDIVVGTGSSVVMFCFFVSFRKSPIGVIVAMVCQIVIVAMGCIDLLMKVFSGKYFEDFLESKRKKVESKKNKSRVDF